MSMDDLYAILELILLYVVAIIFGDLGTRLIPWIQNRLNASEERLKIRLPPLLGMLLAGLLLRNVPGDLLQHIPNSWSSVIRKSALTIILTRAGMGLNLKSLREKGASTLRLAITPCVSEAIFVTLLTKLFRSETPWALCVTLGFVMAAVSPAVVVPSVLMLQEAGYGVEKGIPTMILAASSLDDVLAICGFGVASGIAYSAEGAGNGGGILLSALSAPISIFGGFGVGLAFGYVLGHFIVSTSSFLNSWSMTSLEIFRSLALVLTSLGVVFGSEEAGFAGAGYLAVMVGALTASSMWKKDKEGSCEMCSKLLKFVWSGPRMLNGILEAGRTGMQPALFMLIGAAVDISSISESELGSSLGVLAIALSLRICITYFCVGGDFEFWERLFVAIAWFPKATVQAAVGSEVLDTALSEDEGSDARDVLESNGRFILTAAVLSILLTAPVGAIGIAMTGPRWLKKNMKNQGAAVHSEDDEIELSAVGGNSAAVSSGDKE
eukprot:g4635.t1